MTAIPGSERRPLLGATVSGPATATERLDVTVVVRRGDPAGFQEKVAAVARGDRKGHMQVDDFESAFGATQSDLDKVSAFASSHGLVAVARDAGRRMIVLSGPVSAFDAAFAVKLQQFSYPAGTYRGRTGPIHVPADLEGVVEAVLGLDARPVAKPHFRILNAEGGGAARPAAAGAPSFTPLDLAKLYDFPAGDGAGQCIALIELGGGYKPADLQAYFTGLGLPVPTVTAVGVDHGGNLPTSDPRGPDGEVMLDIEIAGAIAPAARLVVYFAPNTDAGFLDAITKATHDKINRPSIISISWGGPESSWTPQSLTAFDSAFQAAAVLGITVLVASGDNGSSDGAPDGLAHVDFPASSPHVTACGGTRIQVGGGAITSEVVWNDGTTGGAGGGGVSARFALPAWQAGLATTTASATRESLVRRGVPDVAGDADPQSGYQIRVDGQAAVFGGTSAVAPLWAGLIARINANSSTRAGFLNPKLYQVPSSLNDVATGTNGAFLAAAGWDACTGLGSPRGTALARLFGSAAIHD